MVRKWLIEKLDGIPMESVNELMKGYVSLAPTGEIRLIDDFGVIYQGDRKGLISFLGGVIMPKAEEGKCVVRPIVRRLPTRKPHAPAREGIRKIDVMTQLSDGLKPSPVNLCNECGATVKECKEAHPEREQNRTVECNKWRPGVSALKVFRSGSDTPLSGTNVTEPGPPYTGEITSPRLYHV